MRSGNATEAELEFKQMTLSYPQLSSPFVNLGILYRKSGHLDQSEEALKSAVERNDASALAWNELGATQRLRGEFTDAAASYEKAIAADSNYAPAYRNLGVVSDLYLGDPERALTALERYKELTGEDRPVTSWIAELRQRTGKPPLKPAAAAGGSPAPSSAGGAGGTAGAGGAAGAQGSQAAPQGATPAQGATPGVTAPQPSTPAATPPKSSGADSPKTSDGAPQTPPKAGGR
jgi:tetratricopeptide (TPR) repeat protein